MTVNRFYDIHCHAMNMSHPNLLAFIKRFNIHLILMGSAVLGPVFGIFGGTYVKRIENLLSLMENDIADYFLIMEFFLKKSNMYDSQNAKITIGDQAYDKIVLAPLMMDFGMKHIKMDGLFYNLPPKKPIVEQVVDVFNGIRKYCENKLVEKGGKIIPVKDEKDKKLFEIYPFLGINTKNYTEKGEIKERILEKYFSEYKGRREDLYENMGSFNGDIDALGNRAFAGIKFYPPLGFEPWPENGEERQRVEEVYSYCQERRIPLTAHCSDGGFLLDKAFKPYSSPVNWENVLAQYPDLKLNLAHMGSQGKITPFGPEKKAWRKMVLNLVQTKKNVYTDFSCRALKPDYYDELAGMIRGSGKSTEKLKSRILFGTDFMINLLWINSYNKYLHYFHCTEALTGAEKEAFGRTNAEAFLFRGSVTD